MGNNGYGCYPLDVIGAVAATILMVRLSLTKLGKVELENTLRGWEEIQW